MYIVLFLCYYCKKSLSIPKSWMICLEISLLGTISSFLISVFTKGHRFLMKYHNGQGFKEKEPVILLNPTIFFIINKTVFSNDYYRQFEICLMLQ